MYGDIISCGELAGTCIDVIGLASDDHSLFASLVDPGLDNHGVDDIDKICSRVFQWVSRRMYVLSKLQQGTSEFIFSQVPASRLSSVNRRLCIIEDVKIIEHAACTDQV